MKERLEELLQLLNLTPTQFANEIGVQRTTLQHVLSGRNEPSLNIIKAIHAKYPDVELDWLLDGIRIIPFFRVWRVRYSSRVYRIILIF